MQTGISIQATGILSFGPVIKQAGTNLIPANVLWIIPKVQKEPYDRYYHNA